MRKAVMLSYDGMRRNAGGPFGAVIVKDGNIVASGFNCVTSTNDPTAHGEVVAIRNAGAELKTFDLSGCELYTSSQPCAMCLCAAYAARISKIYYANTIQDAAGIGFADVAIYEDLALPEAQRSVQVERLEDTSAIGAFEEWAGKTDKVKYFE